VKLEGGGGGLEGELLSSGRVGRRVINGTGEEEL